MAPPQPGSYPIRKPTPNTTWGRYPPPPPYLKEAPPKTKISILTLNTQNGRYNSPSLTDMVTILDLHSPDILLLTETPMHPHQGALTHVFSNKGYKTHYNLVNSPSPKDTLPEA